MFYVYVLKSLTHGGLYKGYTPNLNTRIKTHNQGKSKYTSRGIPWILVYYEIYENRKDAICREKYFKTAAGRRFLKSKNLGEPIEIPRQLGSSPCPTE